MSLVVGQIHDDGISLVGDTKVTFADDDNRSRHVFENAVPKLVILRDDICVGLSGNDPHGVLATLVGLRDESVGNIVAAAENISHASLIIAMLRPRPQLLQVGMGITQDRSTLGRAWIGDRAAYETFQRRYADWPPSLEVPFLLTSSLQALLSSNVTPSVGGYLTNVATTTHGFRFVPQDTYVGPEEMHGHIALDADSGAQVRFTVPSGADAESNMHLCAVGVPPTIGALAYILAPLGAAILFPHHAPHTPIRMTVATYDELLHRAATEHGQYLSR